MLLLSLLCLALNLKDKLAAWVDVQATPHSAVPIQAHLLDLEMHMYQSLSPHISPALPPGAPSLAPGHCVSSRALTPRRKQNSQTLTRKL